MALVAHEFNDDGIVVESWFAMAINPEPWAVGPVSVGRKNGGIFPIVGQNAQLAAFQEAIREEMEEHTSITLTERVKLTFYFWRVLDSYQTKRGPRHRKHTADTTNMQKALEDALQGILYDNDRTNRDIRSVTVEQGPDVKPKILIHVEYVEDGKPKFPGQVIALLEHLDARLNSGPSDLTHDTGDIF